MAFDHRIISKSLNEIKSSGLFKSERVITSPQSSQIALKSKSGNILNLCSNNYLGLSNNPQVKEAAIKGIEKWGYGLSSVRFICGTQSLHKELEERVSHFLGTEDTILYSSCFDANGGLFETILNDQDTVISDELNHASIIDGIRLCKAKRFRYKNNDLANLEEKLLDAKDSRQILIATDGVFSMDGYISNLNGIAKLAKKYNAMLMVDDSHSVGFIGMRGRGSHEYCDVMKEVDILTGTFGKALGGASGGYISGRKEIIEILRQRSRPYLFSNSLAPAIVNATLKVIDILEASTVLRDKLESNTQYFRNELRSTGLNVLPGTHPIIPVMLDDAVLTGKFSEKLLDNNVYAIGFSYPVVPHGKARIRTQVSADHTHEDLKYAAQAFKKVKDELGC